MTIMLQTTPPDPAALARRPDTPRSLPGARLVKQLQCSLLDDTPWSLLRMGADGVTSDEFFHSYFLVLGRTRSVLYGSGPNRHLRILRRDPDFRRCRCDHPQSRFVNEAWLEVRQRRGDAGSYPSIKRRGVCESGQVQRQAEQAAAISAWVVSITNRLVGESFQEQLLERRDELRAMLADLDVPPERQRTIVMPITKAVANDYRVQIRSEVQRAVVEAISGTEQQVDAIIQEVMAPLENSDRQTGLLELRRHAEQHNLQWEGFHSAVDRYGRFLEQNQDIVKR